MDLKRVGSSGFEVSSLTLGAFEFGRRIETSDAQALVDGYAAAGGTLLELPSSGNRAAEAVGALTLPPSLGIAARVGITGQPDHAHINMGRATLTKQAEWLLATTGLDHIDLLVLDGFDFLTPVEETAQTVEHLQARGLVLHAAAAYLTGWQLAVLAGAGLDLVASFNEHSLLVRNAETTVLPAADYLGIGLFAGAGLGRGLLTGRYQPTPAADSRMTAGPAEYVRQLDGDASRGVVNGVVKAAGALGVDPVDVVMAWNSEQPTLSTCVSPRTPAQLDRLLDSRLQLEPEIFDALNQISER